MRTQQNNNRRTRILNNNSHLSSQHLVEDDVDHHFARARRAGFYARREVFPRRDAQAQVVLVRRATDRDVELAVSKHRFWEVQADAPPDGLTLRLAHGHGEGGSNGELCPRPLVRVEVVLGRELDAWYPDQADAAALIPHLALQQVPRHHALQDESRPIAHPLGWVEVAEEHERHADLEFKVVRRQPRPRLGVEDLDRDVVQVGILPRQRVRGEEMHLVSPRETCSHSLVDLVHDLVGRRQDHVVAHGGRSLAESGENEIDEAIDAALQAKSAGEATPALTAFVRRPELLLAGRAVAEVLEEPRELERLWRRAHQAHVRDQPYRPELQIPPTCFNSIKGIK